MVTDETKVLLYSNGRYYLNGEVECKMGKNVNSYISENWLSSIYKGYTKLTIK